MAQPEAVARVRFSGVQRVEIAGNRCRVRVRLEGPAGAHVGSAEGPASLDDELKCAAEATLDALRQTLHAKGSKTVTLELREVAPFDAFGKPGVMVSIRVEDAKQVRSLLGFSPLGDDPPRAASLATLSATNRFLAVGRP